MPRSMSESLLKCWKKRKKFGKRAFKIVCITRKQILAERMVYMNLPIEELIKIPVFPLAEELPFISDEEAKELEQSLEVNGQRLPITIWNSPQGPMLLDGRNRLRALQNTILTEALVEYFDGDEWEAADQVYDLNIPRRHLKVGQKAAFALAYLPYEERRAKARQGKRTDLENNIT